MCLRVTFEVNQSAPRWLQILARYWYVIRWGLPAIALAYFMLIVVDC